MDEDLKKSKKSYGCVNFSHGFLPQIAGISTGSGVSETTTSMVRKLVGPTQMPKTCSFIHYPISLRIPLGLKLAPLIIPGKNIISHFPPYLSLAFMSWTHPILQITRVKCSEKQILWRFCAIFKDGCFSRVRLGKLANFATWHGLNGTFHYMNPACNRCKKWLVGGQGWWFTMRGRNFQHSKLTTHNVSRI